MRCPYCGGINQERAAFCVNCGRDIARGAFPPHQQPSQPSQPPYKPPARPTNAPKQPAQRGANSQARAQAAPSRPANQPVQTTSRRQSQVQTPVIPVQPTPPPAPEPPALFPPRALNQFNALMAAGAQQYTILERVESNNRKSSLRIAYADCANWQQAATLLKALQEQSDGKFDTIIIQGFSARQPNATTFNLGQLQFDRNVLLGSRRSNRYIVETGNGFASDAVRFVLNE